MKKIVLISSYCDTEEKINILKKNLIIYKELGLDTLLISPLKLSEDVINLCDFYFFTKENPILCWPERAYTHWVKIETDTNQKLTLHRGHCDYGWAALYQTKILLELGLMLKYDILIHTIYDILIDDDIQEKLLSDEYNIIFTRRDPHQPDVLWESTLHLLIVNSDVAKKIANYINKDVYTSSYGFAESHVLIWKNEYNLSTSENPVKDQIFYWEGYDHFNYSLDNNYKLFMSKNTDVSDEFTLVLTKENIDYDLEILINGVKITTERKKIQYFKTGISVDNIYEIKIKSNNQTIDYLETFNGINRNVIDEAWI